MPTTPSPTTRSSSLPAFSRGPSSPHPSPCMLMDTDVEKKILFEFVDSEKILSFNISVQHSLCKRVHIEKLSFPFKEFVYMEYPPRINTAVCWFLEGNIHGLLSFHMHEVTLHGWLRKERELSNIPLICLKQFMEDVNSIMSGSLLIIDEFKWKKRHDTPENLCSTSHICLKSESRLIVPHLVGCDCDLYFSSPELFWLKFVRCPSLLSLLSSLSLS